MEPNFYKKVFNRLSFLLAPEIILQHFMIIIPKVPAHRIDERNLTAIVARFAIPIRNQVKIFQRLRVFACKCTHKHIKVTMMGLFILPNTSKKLCLHLFHV